MRLSIPAKIFAAFLSVLLVSSIMAWALWVGLREMHLAAEDLSHLKDFQTSLQGLELFNWGPESRMPEGRKLRFDSRFDDLRKRTEELKALSASMPPEIRDNLPLLDEQSAYFKKAYEELLAMQGKDEEYHQRQHHLMERLALKLNDPGSADLRDEFSRFLFFWGRAYHDRDIDSINGMHDLLEKTKAKAVNTDTRKLLGDIEYLLDASYLNYLALVERESFIEGTTKRYVQLSNRELGRILAYEDERQKKLMGLIAGAILLSVAITAFYWVKATRYIYSFLDNSRKIVTSIRQGEIEKNGHSHADDEFGDLLRFMAKIGADLKESMATVRSSEEKYRTLVEDLSDWVWETDEEGRCRYSGPLGKKMLQLEDGSIIGRRMDEVLCSGDAGEENHNCAKLLAGGDQASGVLSYVALPGDGRIALESSWKQILDKSGAPVGLRGISRNVTERLDLEAERRSMQSQLMHAQKMEAIGTLSGGVAHDFNNLLQTIGGFADILLKRGNLCAPDKETAAQIAQTAVNASRLTKQLLIFSRRADVQMIPMDINAEIVKVRQMMERMIPKEIALVTELAENAPAVLADQMQIEQVLINLIINARDAIDSTGTITIRTKVTSGGTPPSPGASARTLELTVADTGRGIPHELRQRIFEPFFTTKEAGKGTGLGLAIVYGIAEAHNAKLTCESEVGRGTAFTLCFPVLEGVSLEADNGSPVQESPAASGKKLKILVVDDEHSITDSCSEILTLEGYETHIASSGEEALSVYREKGAGFYDLVILDLSMPGMGGAECFKRIRDINPAQAVVLASGYADADVLTKNRLEANAFLKKPYRLRTLLEIVRTVTDAQT